MQTIKKVNQFLSINTEEITPGLHLSSMPFWEGAQKKYGISKCLPFDIVAEKGKPIMQISHDNLIDDVVNCYQSENYTFITSPPGTSLWADELGNRKIKVVQEGLGEKKPKDILEIGGGSLWVGQKLIAIYNPDSYTIIDPALKTSELGVNVIQDYFPSRHIGGKFFDLILGFNVLEHVTDPLGFLLNIKKHLKPGGKVILNFPDCERQLSQGDLNVLIHEHITYFTEKSTRWISEAAGFNILLLKSNNDLFTLILENMNKDFDKEHKIDESELLNLSFKMFENLFDKTTKKIAEVLDAGNFVGFHGATHGLNSFLYISGLENHSNIRIYDNDSSKEGLYLPSCKNKILTAKDETYGQNSLLVISAMSFFEEIKSNILQEKIFGPKSIFPLLGQIL